MLATRCPGCGRPSELSLAAPDAMSCRACGYAGAPPEGVAERLRAAGQLLSGLAAKERQLSDSQKRMVSSGAHRLTAFASLSMAVTVPFLGCAIWGGVGVLQSDAPTPHVAALTGLFVLPLLIVVAVAILGLRRMGAQARTLRATCAASPPPAPGAPAGCHVCGGPLEHAAEPFVRCGFCAADNFVGEEALGRVVELQEDRLDRFEVEVQAEGSAVAEAGRAITKRLLRSALLAPLLVCLGFAAIALAVFATLSSIETPVHADQEYTWLDTSRGRCIANVKRRPTGIQLDPGAQLRRERVELAPDAPLDTFGATELRGRILRSRRNTSDGVLGRVERVFGTEAGTNGVLLRDETGRAHDIRGLTGLCEPGPGTHG